MSKIESLPQMSRRRLLLGLVGVGGAAAVGVGKWLLGVPDISRSACNRYPHPNWLYSTTKGERPPLIAVENGAGIELFLRHLVFKNDLLYEATKIGLRQFYFENPQNRRLGDIFLDHLQTAAQLLEKKFKVNPSLENTLLVAAITYGTVISPYLRQQDFVKMGIEVDMGDHGDKLFLAEPFIQAVPHVFPVDPSWCHSELDLRARCLGSDRASHAVAHFVLGTIIMHGLVNNLEEVQRIPRGLWLQLEKTQDMKKKIAIFSDATGYWFEWLQSFKALLGQSSLDEKGDPIPTGHFDPLTWVDIRANQLGRDAVLALIYNPWRNPLTVEKIKNAISVLNSPMAYGD